MITTVQRRCRRPGAVSLTNSLGRRLGWSALRVRCEDNHAKFASARVLRGRTSGSPRGDARAGRVARGLIAVVTSFRSKSRRTGTVSVKKSFVQWRGVECAKRWL